MGNIPPIDPFAHVRVEGTHEKKEEEDKKKPSLPPPNKKKWFAAAIYYFQKKIREFTGKTIPYATIQNDIESILQSFTALAEKDVSHDAEFLKEMSHNWLQFLHHFHEVENQKDPFISQISQFIKETQSYPPDSRYSLGYYLAEYAGLKWLPSPYMDILKMLHNDFQQNPGNSQLQKWIDTLKHLKEMK